MYTPTKPNPAALLLATLGALVTAILILVTIVLPAEYGLDPTGLGARLGLKKMGEIKTQLAAEAAAEEISAPMPLAPVPEATPEPPTPSAEWRDQREITLVPGQGIELKLAMESGAEARFQWETRGGPLNCDTHGDNATQKINYKKSRGITGDEGSLKAAFTGNHGWFWRNRAQGPVTLILKVAGDYQSLKRIK